MKMSSRKPCFQCPSSANTPRCVPTVSFSTNGYACDCLVSLLAATAKGYAKGEDTLEFFKGLKLRGRIEAAGEECSPTSETEGHGETQEILGSKSYIRDENAAKAPIVQQHELYTWQLIETFKLFFCMWSMGCFEDDDAHNFGYSGCQSTDNTVCCIPSRLVRTVEPLELNSRHSAACGVDSRKEAGWACILEVLHVLLFKSATVNSLFCNYDMCNGKCKSEQHNHLQQVSAATEEALASDAPSLNATASDSFAAAPESVIFEFGSSSVEGANCPLAEPSATSGTNVCRCEGCLRATEAATDPDALCSAKRNAFRMLLALGDVCLTLIKDEHPYFMGNRVSVLLGELSNSCIERLAAEALAAAWRRAGAWQRHQDSTSHSLQLSLLKSCTHLFTVRCGALTLAAQLLVPLAEMHSALHVKSFKSRDNDEVDGQGVKGSRGNAVGNGQQCSSAVHEVASSLVAVLQADTRVGGPLCRALLKVLNAFFSVTSVKRSTQKSMASITCGQPSGSSCKQNVSDRLLAETPADASADSEAFIVRGISAWHCLRRIVIELAATPNGAESLLDLILKPLGRNGDIPCRLPLASALIDIFAGCCPMPLKPEQTKDPNCCLIEGNDCSLPRLAEGSSSQNSPDHDRCCAGVASCLKCANVERACDETNVCLACGAQSPEEATERRLLSQLYMQFFRRVLVRWADASHLHSSSLEQQVALTFCMCRCIHRAHHAASFSSANFDSSSCVPCNSWVSPQQRYSTDPDRVPLMGDWEVRHLLDGIHIRLNASTEPLRCCALAAANGFAAAFGGPRSDRRLKESSAVLPEALEEAPRTSDTEDEEATSLKDTKKLLKRNPALTPLVLDAASGWTVEGTQDLWKAAAEGNGLQSSEFACAEYARALSNSPDPEVPLSQATRAAHLPSSKALLHAMRSELSSHTHAEEVQQFDGSRKGDEQDFTCFAQSSGLGMESADVAGRSSVRESMSDFAVDKISVDIEESGDEDDPHFASLPHLKPLHAMQQVQGRNANAVMPLLRNSHDVDSTLAADYGAFPAPPQSLLQVLEWLTNNMAISDLPAGTLLSLTSCVRRPAEAGGRGETAAQRLYRLATATQALTRLLIVKVQCMLKHTPAMAHLTGDEEQTAEYPLGLQLFHALLSMDTSLDSALLDPLRASSLSALIAVFFKHLLPEVEAVVCKSDYTLGQKLLLLQTIQRAAKWLREGAPADGRNLCTEVSEHPSISQLNATRHSQEHFMQPHLTGALDSISTMDQEHQPQQQRTKQGWPGNGTISKSLCVTKESSRQRTHRFARPAQIKKGVVNLFCPLMAAVFVRLLSCLQPVYSPSTALTPLEQQVLLRRRKEKERVLEEPLLVAAVLITAAEILRCGGAAADGYAKRLCCSRAVDVFFHFSSHREMSIRRGAICVLSSAASLAPWNTVLPWLEEGDSTAGGKAAFRRAPATIEYCSTVSFVGATKGQNKSNVFTYALESGGTAIEEMTRQNTDAIQDVSGELWSGGMISLSRILGRLALEDSDSGCREMAGKLLVNWFNRNENGMM